MNCLILLGFVASISLLTSCETNTHQTLVMKPKPVYPINFTKNDHIKIIVFNTVASVKIRIEAQQLNYVRSRQKYCFIGENFTVEHRAKWNASGSITLSINAHEYSFEIQLNGILWKSKYDYVSDFIDGEFSYIKYLPTNQYDFKIYYESEEFPLILFYIANHMNLIPANANISVAYNILQTEVNSQYQILFSLYQTPINLSERGTEIQIQVPNALLKGCDGTNLYDSRMRVCPQTVTEGQFHDEMISIHNAGGYNSFEVLQKTKVSIKLTMLEIQKWPFLIKQSIMRFYLAKDIKYDELKQYKQSTIKSTLTINQKCQLSTQTCNFLFFLQSGNYTMIPIVDSISYSLLCLTQIKFDNNLVQTLYLSTFVHYSDKEIPLQNQMLLEVALYKNKLAQIVFQSDQELFRYDYALFKRTTLQIGTERRPYLDNVEWDYDPMFSQNPYKTSLFLDPQVSDIYLLAISIASLQKLKQFEVNQSKKHIQTSSNNMNQTDQENYQSDPLDRWGPPNFLQPSSISYTRLNLQASILQISIKNGRFPHKKLHEPTLAQVFMNSDLNSGNQNQNSLFVQLLLEKYLILIGVIGGFFLVVVLVFAGCRIRSKIIAKKVTESKELVEEKSSVVVEIQNVSTIGISGLQQKQIEN